MKRAYIKPSVIKLAIEPCGICADSTLRWHVDATEGEHEHVKSDNNWGIINFDKGKGNYEEDPWDSDNW